MKMLIQKSSCVLILFFVISSMAFGQRKHNFTQAQVDSIAEAYVWSKNPRHLFRGKDKSDSRAMPPAYIDDSGAPGTVMVVSESMYRSIREWSMNRSASSAPLSQYLGASFPSAEVDTFMKRFNGGSQSYFTGGGGGTTGGRGGGGGGEECRCKYLTFAPTGNQYGIVTMSPNYEKEFPPYYDSGNKWEGSMTRSAHGAGRAEYGRLKAWGNKDKTWDAAPVSNDAYVKMTILYLCTDENELPDDCGCEKEVKARAEFRGDLYAQAKGNTTGFPWIPSRDVHAKVEGAAMMGEYVIGPSFDTLKIPMARLHGAYAKERVSWDPNFAIRIIDMATNIVTNVASGGFNIGALKDSAVAIIKDLVTNDTIMTNTSDMSGPVAMNQSAEGNLPLLPGQEKVVYLGSMTETFHKIKTGISNEGRASTYFASAFRLHVVVPYDNTQPECCVEKYGMWAHGGFDFTTIFDTVTVEFPFGTFEVPISYQGFTSDPNVGAMEDLRNNLVTEFVGPWDSFDPNEYYGTTTYSGQACDCNVKAVLELTDQTCSDVTIDISNSIYPDDYYLEISEVDANGEFIGGWVGSWFTTLPNIINLSGPNSPLGNGSYNFQQGKYYKIKLAVNGHCTDWDAMSVIFQAEGGSVADFDVVTDQCDNFTIDISNTTGASNYFLSVRRVNEDGVGICCYSSTGWVSSLGTGNIISLTDPTGPLGAYDFQGGNHYLVQLAVSGPCTSWIADEQVITVPITTTPSFTVNPQCAEVIFDASNTQNEDEYKIELFQVDDFGFPVPGTETTITTGINGWVPGDISANPNHPFDLTNYFIFSPGLNYRVTLSVKNNCTSEQSEYQDFNYSFEPVPLFELPNSICEGDDVAMNLSSSVSVEEIKIEVYLSDQFGNIDPGAPVINFTQGWVANNSPLVILSPDPLLTVVGGEWYTVRLYGRNSCSANEEMNYTSFYVKTPQQCLIMVDEVKALCHADFDEDPGHTSFTSAEEVRFIDRSIADMGIYRREWSFGNGMTEDGMSPSVRYTANSTYDVTLIISDYSGCRDTVTKQVVVSGIRGGLKRVGADANDSFKVFPNPASSRLNISYNLESSATFQIANILGQVVKNVPLGTGQATVSMGTGTLPAGIYIYRFIDDKGQELKSGRLILSVR